MSLQVQDLLKSVPNNEKLGYIVAEQLKMIDDKLLRSDKMWGKNYVIHELPYRFDIPGVITAEIQRFVYSQVIENLESRGFEVRINISQSSEKAVLYVMWEIQVSEEEKKRMNAMIASHSITKKDLESMKR